MTSFYQKMRGASSAVSDSNWTRCGRLSVQSSDSISDGVASPFCEIDLIWSLSTNAGETQNQSANTEECHGQGEKCDHHKIWFSCKMKQPELCR